jgi:hypothetical protein
MTKDNRLRRKCRACSKRINLVIIWIDGIKMLKCPSCLKSVRYTNQQKYEETKEKWKKLKLSNQLN